MLSTIGKLFRGDFNSMTGEEMSRTFICLMHMAFWTFFIKWIIQKILAGKEEKELSSSG
jgi:hypothetical protein